MDETRGNSSAGCPLRGVRGNDGVPVLSVITVDLISPPRKTIEDEDLGFLKLWLAFGARILARLELARARKIRGHVYILVTIGSSCFYNGKLFEKPPDHRTNVLYGE